MKRLLFIAALALAPFSAFAQQPTPGQQPDPATVQLQLDETSFLLAQRRAQVVAQQREIEKLKKDIAEAQNKVAHNDKSGDPAPAEK